MYIWYVPILPNHTIEILYFEYDKTVTFLCQVNINAVRCDLVLSNIDMLRVGLLLHGFYIGRILKVKHYANLYLSHYMREVLLIYPNTFVSNPVNILLSKFGKEFTECVFCELTLFNFCVIVM